MDVVGNIMTIIDIADRIKGAVETVKGFEELAKRLNFRVQILRNVVDPLRNVIASNKQKISPQTAIKGVAHAIEILRDCLQKASDFVVKVAGTKLVKKFISMSKYGERFREIGDELRQIQDDLKMALQAEIFIVVTKEQREQLKGQVERSSKCFDKKKAFDEDEEDQKKDMANIMSLLEDLEKDQQQKFQNVEECQKITLKEQKQGFNEALDRHSHIEKDQEEGFQMIEDGIKKIDEHQDQRKTEVETKNKDILSAQADHFKDVNSNHTQIKEGQEKGFQSIENEQLKTLNDLRTNFLVQEELSNEVQEELRSGFCTFTEEQQLFLTAQHEAFESQISNHITLYNDQKAAFLNTEEKQKTFLKDQIDGSNLFERGQQLTIQGQEEELKILQFLEAQLTDWTGKILPPKVDTSEADTQVSQEDMQELPLLSSYDIASANLPRSIDDMQSMKMMSAVSDVRSHDYDKGGFNMQRKKMLMEKEVSASAAYDDLIAEAESWGMQQEDLLEIEESIPAPKMQEVLEKIMEVQGDQEEGFKNIEEGQEMIRKGQQKWFDDMKTKQNQLLQEQQTRIKQSETSQKNLLSKQEERFDEISKGQDNIMKEQSEGFNNFKMAQEDQLQEQTQAFELVEERQHMFNREQEEGFDKLSAAQRKTQQEQREGFQRIHDEQENIAEDQRQEFGRLSDILDTIGNNQEEEFGTVDRNQEHMNKGQTEMFHSYANNHRKILEAQAKILQILRRIYQAARSKEEISTQDKDTSTPASDDLDADQQGEPSKQDTPTAMAIDDQNQKGSIDTNVMIWEKDLNLFLERLAEFGELEGKDFTTEIETMPRQDAPRVILEPEVVSTVSHETYCLKADETKQEEAKSWTYLTSYTTEAWPHGLCFIRGVDMDTEVDGTHRTGRASSGTHDDVIAICHGAPDFTVDIVRQVYQGSTGYCLEKIHSLSPAASPYSRVWNSHPVGVACIGQNTDAKTLAIVCARDRFVHFYSTTSFSYQSSFAIEEHDIDPTCIAVNYNLVVIGVRNSNGQTGKLILRNLEVVHRGEMRQVLSDSALVVPLNFVPIDLDLLFHSQYPQTELLITGAEGVFKFGVTDGKEILRNDNRTSPGDGWQFRAAKYGMVNDVIKVIAARKNIVDCTGSIVEIEEDQNEHVTRDVSSSKKVLIPQIGGPGFGGLAVSDAGRIFVAEEWDNRVRVFQKKYF
ncbi:uncharacterized protein [Amphiura filiformis]|uniref:uncharacterized protein isoform X2 n=1 Tax=Amphiura filiformis TaxID=82378 RepID=UPI003B221B07